MLFKRKEGRAINRALTDMREAAAKLAASVMDLVPAGHPISEETLRSLEDQFASDLIESMRPSLVAQGYSHDAIVLWCVPVEAAFRKEFSAQLRSRVGLDHLPVEGRA